METFGARPEAYVNVTERMPYRGRSGFKDRDLEVWYVSEGIRRLVAIFAVLEASPKPSIVCIEEIENGLDPFTLEYVVQSLRSSADRGTQILVTSHSPYLLDMMSHNEVVFVDRTGGDSQYQRAKDSEEAKKWGARLPPGSLFVSSAKKRG